MWCKSVSEGKKSAGKKQVLVLINLLIHIFGSSPFFSLLLFPTYLCVGMDSQPRGTCQGCDKNSLNPKKGTIVPAIVSGS